MFSAAYKAYKISGPLNIPGSVLFNGSVRHSQSIPPQITLCEHPSPPDHVYFPQQKLRKTVPDCNILSRDKISSSILVFWNTKTKKLS